MKRVNELQQELKKSQVVEDVTLFEPVVRKSPKAGASLISHIAFSNGPVRIHPLVSRQSSQDEKSEIEEKKEQPKKSWLCFKC